ncbi:MAG: hypothetical protein ACLRSW_08765 [Christensenellaceae bacterium]
MIIIDRQIITLQAHIIIIRGGRVILAWNTIPAVEVPVLPSSLISTSK